MRCPRSPAAVPLLALLAALVAACTAEIKGDPAPLKVVSTTPANGEEGVALETALRVEFDDELDARSVQSGVMHLEPAAQGAIVVEGRSIVFTPYEPLQANTPYLAEVSPGIRGNQGGTLSTTHGFRFNTRGSTTDVRAPAAVQDLALTVTSGNSVALTWTATGDDGLTGTATRYDLRWAADDACPLETAEDFAAATQRPLPSPLEAGQAESTTVTDLPRKSLVCMALVVVDEFGNRSSLSNAVSAQLPDLVFPDNPVIGAGTVGEDFVTLRWTAVGDDGDVGPAREYRVFFQEGQPCTLSPETAGLEVDGGTATELPFRAPAEPGTAEAITITGLLRDTDYCFLLRVRDTGWNAAWSNVLSQHTPDLTAPHVPILAAQVGLTDVQFAWDAVGDDGLEGTVTRQQLQHAEGRCPLPLDPFPSTAVSTPISISVAGTPVTHQETGLLPDTDHCYRLEVEDNVGHVVHSPPLEVHTVDPAPPANPVLNLDQVGSDSVTFSWVSPGDNGQDGRAAREELWVAEGADCAVLSPTNTSSANLVRQQVPAPPGTPQSFTLGNVTPDADHCALLVVKDETSAYGTSGVVPFRTLDEEPPASPFVSLDVPATGRTSLTVKWIAPGDNSGTGRATSQFLRQWPTTSACAFDPPPGTTVTTVPLPAPATAGTPESATVTGLQEDSVYCLQLVIQDEVPNAAVCNVVTAKTLDLTPPDAPTLSADLLPGGLYYEWNAVGDNGMDGLPASYELRVRRAEGTGCPTDASGLLAGDVTHPLELLPVMAVAGKATYRVERPQLLTRTWYCAQVVVVDEVDRAAHSAVVASETSSRDIIPPDPIADLRVVRYQGMETLELEWTAPADTDLTSDAGTATVTGYRGHMATGADCVPPGSGPAFEADAGTVSALPLVLAPRPAGTVHEETLTVPTLDLVEAACFRLGTQDAVGNASPLSNLAFPPAPVDTLTATSPGNGTVDLAWTAVGAHHRAGRADAYQFHVRSGVNRVCPRNAHALLSLTGELFPGQSLPVPSPAGASETGQLTQLSPDEPLCVALEVLNSDGDRSYSNVVSVTVKDDVPPAPFQLNFKSATTVSAELTWTETYDNGADPASGPPDTWRFVVVEVPAPSQVGDDPCAQSLDFALSQVVPPTLAVTVSSLQPSTWYCAQMQAQDNEGLSGFSNVVPFQTGAVQGDGDPPAQPTLLALAAGDVRSLATAAPEADLAWHAVAEDGVAAGADAAQGHAVLYRDTLLDGTPVASAADCAALNALQDPADRQQAEAGAFKEQLPASGGLQVGDPVSATVVFSQAAAEQPLCVAVRAVDDSGLATASPWIYVRDNTAPAAPTDFMLSSSSAGQVTLSLTAPGDDDALGAARTYQLAHVAGACVDVASTFDTLSIQQHDVSSVVPGNAGNKDLLTASTGLQPESTYCFRVRALDDAGNASPYAFTTVVLPSAAAFELKALRDAVDQASPPSVSGLSVSGATVSYVKPDLSAGRAGADALDTAAGFFVQGGPGEPAVFVMLANAGLQPGQRVDLSGITAEKLSAAGVQDADGMVVITAATVTPRAGGGSCATTGCPDFFTCDSGLCSREVSHKTLEDLAPFEHQRVTTAVTLSGRGTWANGFVTFPVATVGTGEPSELTLLLPSDVAVDKQLQPGVALAVVGTPLWREGVLPQLAAWRAEDLEVPTRFQFESPSAGSTDVPVSLASVRLKMNHAPLASPQGGTAGPCQGDPYVELSADGFQSCVGGTVSQDVQDATRLLLSPAGPLETGRRYRVRLPDDVTGDGALVSEGSFVTVPSSACTARDLVISRFVVDTGPASPLNAGYVEVHNRSGTDMDLSMQDLEVAVSGGDADRWTFLPLNTTVPAGGYATVTLPPNLSTEGAVAALVHSDADGDTLANAAEANNLTNPFAAQSDPLYVPDGCPSGTMALDMVGFGAKLHPGCALGYRAPTPAAGEGLSRRAEGCVDHGDNAGDFDAAPIQLGRAGMSPPNGCYCGGQDVSDSNLAAEADYCVVQSSASWHDAAGAAFTVYGQVYEQNVTEAGGASPNVRAEVGFARAGTSLPGFTFRSAAYNPTPLFDPGNNDEYQATLTAPAEPGAQWRYLFRFSVDLGTSWTYCDVNGSGFNNYPDQSPMLFSPADMGTLSICSEGTQPDSNHAACVP